MQIRGYWVNFSKTKKRASAQLLGACFILTAVALWSGLAYELFSRVQSHMVVVQVDGKTTRLYAPDWEVEEVLVKSGIILGDRDRVQITKSFGRPIEFAVLREALEPKPPERPMIATSRGEMPYKLHYKMEATAYLPSDGNGLGITATGIRATYGVVAVDPKVIPLGSRVYIPGYGFAVAADTGGAIKGQKIDLCMESYNEAISFGRRSVEVYVL